MDNKKVKEALDNLRNTICGEGHRSVTALVKSMGYVEPEPEPEPTTNDALQDIIKVLKEAGPNEVYFSANGDYIVFFKHCNKLSFRLVHDLDELVSIIEWNKDPDEYVTTFRHQLEDTQLPLATKLGLLSGYGLDDGLTYKFNYAV